MANYHVVKNHDGEWAVKRDSATKASGLFHTQSKAEKSAKGFARNSGGGEVRIHNLQGKIRDSDTVPPAIDPNPPKDKRH